MKVVKKAIVLAGGRATRLFPLTEFGISKQALPIYDKPVIWYPLGTLQKMGFEEILVIAGYLDQMKMYQAMLGDGSEFGIKISYTLQKAPNGLAEAFIIGEDFINGDPVALILGDNVFVGNMDYTNILLSRGVQIFTYEVRNPEKYGVAVFDENGFLLDLVEKPKEHISDQAIVGFYIFDSTVVERAKTLTPSARGELEIVDLIKTYLHDDTGVVVNRLENIMWFDVGDFDSLLDCANLVRTIEKRSTQQLGLRKL